MKGTKKLLSIFLASVLSLGVFALFGCSKQNNDINEAANNLVCTPIESNGIEIITLNSETVETETEKYMTKQITAVLSSELVGNKITWSARWGNNALQDDVTNYIKVSCDSSTTTAYIYCYAPFTGSTVIVDALCGNASASCVVEYLGLADRAGIEFNNVLDSGYIDLTLDKGSYNIELNLQNVFGKLDISSASFTINEITGNGQFIAKKATALTDSTTYEDMTILMSNYVNNFVSASIDGNTLKLTVHQTVNTYYVQGNRGWIEFKEYYYDPRGGGEPTPCTVNISITETTTSNTIFIALAPFSSMALSDYSIAF